MSKSRHTYRETDMMFGGRVNGMCEPDKDGAYSLVTIANNTFKVANNQVETFADEFTSATAQPEDPSEDGAE